MGFGRFLAKMIIPGYNTVDAIKKIADNGIVDGVKIKVKEDWCEDNPLTSSIYGSGKFDGKKEGYIEASNEYEEKLLKQAEIFLREKEKLSTNIKEREQLLDEYEQYIAECEKDISELTREKLELLYIIKNTYLELKNI